MKIIGHLRNRRRAAEEVGYLATDPETEGEAICEATRQEGTRAKTKASRAQNSPA